MATLLLLRAGIDVIVSPVMLWYLGNVSVVEAIFTCPISDTAGDNTESLVYVSSTARKSPWWQAEGGDPLPPLGGCKPY